MTNGTNGYKGPLDGIRVIDWTMWQFGPVSTMMLADMGAEVIKVESLDGDHGRQFGRVGGVQSDLPEGVNAYFEGMNRQKLGLALDLKNPRGVEILHELVKKSDVFVENFRNGVAERLGIGYEDLVQHNPQIIYASEQAMDAAGDLIYERVQRTLDLADDPQVVQNDYVVDVDHPVLGHTKWLQTPVTYSKTPLSTRKMAPAHGEDTERLRIELLDYTWDDIASLQEDGVIL